MEALTNIYLRAGTLVEVAGHAVLLPTETCVLCAPADAKAIVVAVNKTTAIAATPA